MNTVNECRARLHAAGWSLGEAAGRRWLVSGTNGENVLLAAGDTQAEAWHRACEQAAAVGMLGKRDQGDAAQSSITREQCGSVKLIAMAR